MALDRLHQEALKTVPDAVDPNRSREQPCCVTSRSLATQPKPHEL